MKDDYSNREIDLMFHEVHAKLDLILEQTTKTNGQVKKHEKILWVLTGAGMVLGAMSIPNAQLLFKVISGV